MSKRQTRQTTSWSGSTYRRIAAKAAAEGKSIAGWLEAIVAPHIDGIPDPGPDAYKAKSAKPEYGPVVPLEEAFPPRFL